MLAMHLATGRCQPKTGCSQRLLSLSLVGTIRDFQQAAVLQQGSRPIGEVPDHDPEHVAALPEHVRSLFRSLNTRKIDYDLPNRPDDMARHAPGISPRRHG